MKRSNDAFGRRLLDAGAAVTPPTSEQLHARVMADVRRERAIASSSTATRGRAHWWWLTGAATAAAAIALGVAVWVTTSREPGAQPVKPVVIAALPPVPSLDSVVAETVEPVRAKLHEARFAYLDRDTKRLARFLIRAVPGVPAEAKKAIDPAATPSSASGT